MHPSPGSTNPEGKAEAEARLFTQPSTKKEICAEWKSYVEPELRRIFRSATETVAADLAQLNGNEKSLRNRTLRIPLEHADAWLNTLNQARLVIAAKNKFTDEELSDHDRSPIGSRRRSTSSCPTSLAPTSPCTSPGPSWTLCIRWGPSTTAWGSTSPS